MKNKNNYIKTKLDSFKKMFNKAIFIVFCLFCNIVFSFQEEKNTIKEHTDSLEYYYYTAREKLYHFDVKSSIDNARKGLTLATKNKDNYRIASFYNIIGYNLEFTGDEKESRMYHFKALEYAIKAGDNGVLSNVYTALGNSYVEPEDLEYSLECYNKALEYAIKDNEKLQILTVTLNIGWSYIDAKQYDKAYPYLIETKSLINDEVGDNLAYVQINYLLAVYYKSKNNILKTKFHLDEAFKYNDDINNAREFKDIHFMYSKIHEEEGNFKKSLEHYKKYYAFQQKIFDADQLYEKEKASSRFELEEYKRSINNVKSKNEAQSLVVKKTRQTLIASLVALLILLLFLINFYRSSSYKAKTIKILKQKNEDLKKSKKETESLSKEKEQYLSTVSHEIRTPLYGLIGLTTILGDEHPELKGSEHLKSLEFSANHLLELINDVLQINKMDVSQVKLENIPFNIKTLFYNVVNSIQVFLDKNNNKCIVNIDKNIPYLNSDPVRLSQILLNLLSNAAKFTKNGEIIFSAELLERKEKTCEILIKVKDNGIGIPKEQHDTIFNKFSQIKGEVGYFKGTGLGLPIVKRLLSLFNSKIELKSEVGKGSEFSFKIVLNTSKKVNRKTENRHLSVSEIIPKNQNILVVEDNEINQIVTRKVLEKVGYNCDVSFDGLEAIDKIASKNYNLILMDINMPKMGGIEATKIILERNPKAVILALTASDDQKLKEEILKTGMKDVVLKPYDLQKFHQIILKNLVESDAEIENV